VRWQYRVVNVGMYNTPDRLASVLGQLGSNGWELVHVYDKQSNWLAGMEKGFAIFKRAVPDGEEPPDSWALWAPSLALQPLPAPSRKRTGEGWRDDPSGRHPHRYYDGKNWTEWVRDKEGGTRTVDPPYVDIFPAFAEEE